AEDGVRHDLVTGVQTCALPIYDAAVAAAWPTVTAGAGASDGDQGGSVSDVRYEVVGSVARVTIDRPERRNAMSFGVMEGLRDSVAAAKADDAVRVLVLTGAGEKAFCAGADLGRGGTPDEAPARAEGRGGPA